MKQPCNRLRDLALDMAQLSIELPRRIDRVLGAVERGNLRVSIRRPLSSRSRERAIGR
jgi:hypothetical protein